MQSLTVLIFLGVLGLTLAAPGPASAHNVKHKYCAEIDSDYRNSPLTKRDNSATVRLEAKYKYETLHANHVQPGYIREVSKWIEVKVWKLSKHNLSECTTFNHHKYIGKTVPADRRFTRRLRLRVDNGKDCNFSSKDRAFKITRQYGVADPWQCHERK